MQFQMVVEGDSFFARLADEVDTDLDFELAPAMSSVREERARRNKTYPVSDISNGGLSTSGDY